MLKSVNKGAKMQKVKYVEEDGRTKDERENRLPKFSPKQERNRAGTQ